MKTTLIELGHCSVQVIGSNGLVGSNIIDAASRRGLLEQNSWQLRDFRYERNSAVESNNLICKQLQGNKNVVISCYGPKGFNLDDSELSAAHDCFKEMCQMLQSHERNISGHIMISSLGARMSQIVNPYSTLVLRNEQYSQHCLPGKNRIIRLPSIFGENNENGRLSGLLGVMLSNTLRGKTTSIYGGLLTRRNYLESGTCGSLILEVALHSRRYRAGSIASQSRIIELSANRNFTTLELINRISHSVKKAPIITMLSSSDVNHEDHVFSIDKRAYTIKLESGIDQWLASMTAQLSSRGSL